MFRPRPFLLLLLPLLPAVPAAPVSASAASLVAGFDRPATGGFLRHLSRLRQYRLLAAGRGTLSYAEIETISTTLPDSQPLLSIA